MLGVLVNTATVIVGSIIGIFIKKGINDMLPAFIVVVPAYYLIGLLGI